jgi:hypothetical protein
MHFFCPAPVFSGVMLSRPKVLCAENTVCCLMRVSALPHPTSACAPVTDWAVLAAVVGSLLAGDDAIGNFTIVVLAHFQDDRIVHGNVLNHHVCVCLRGKEGRSERIISDGKHDGVTRCWMMNISKTVALLELLPLTSSTIPKAMLWLERRHFHSPFDISKNFFTVNPDGSNLVVSVCGQRSVRNFLLVVAFFQARFPREKSNHRRDLKTRRKRQLLGIKEMKRDGKR